MKLDILYEDKNGMPRRKLGKTGFRVPLFSLGGQGALESHGSEKNCIEIIQRAYDLGVRYMDTSPLYDESELFYGQALKGWRNKIFLASKTDIRDRDGSLKEIEKSFKRLKTDYLDLWQIHHVDTMDEVNQITAKGGALDALVEMHDQGVVKNLGVTSHAHPSLLVEMMKRYPFDTILCPVNVGDRTMEHSFIDIAVKEANKRNIGIIGMKVFAQGHVFQPGAVSTTWAALTYAWSQPIDTTIIGIDNIAQLEECVAIAKGFTPMDRDTMKDIETKMKPFRKYSCFFRRELGGYDSKKKLGKPNMPIDL
jgi:aryl-alcohol dehydrogenase-like predicted oxidoreductase